MKRKFVKVRESKKISQKDFAKIIGCKANWLNKIENNKVNPGVELAKRIAENLDITLDDIFLK